MNGMDAMPKGGQLRVSLRRERASSERGGGEVVCVAVSDEGVGMDVPTGERVFEPFFTTKEVGEGTGLGLSVAHGIVEDRGGWIAVQSEPGAGSTFDVFLPVNRS